ncbi:MAG TPA: hypothetical protein VKB78_11135 [Pirellulales bacterium]|nr:hypothetical protein [Pirellulales bacterium]
MARQEHDREDLLAEATALVDRVELQIDGNDETIIVGLRPNGAAAIYFGEDFAYQFNADRQLRRAFLDDRLYKADGGRLAALRRERTPGEVQLLRHDLSSAETAAFLERMSNLIGNLRNELLSGRTRILRQVSATGDAVAQISQWIRLLPEQIEIAKSPRAGR